MKRYKLSWSYACRCVKTAPSTANSMYLSYHDIPNYRLCFEEGKVEHYSVGTGAEMGSFLCCAEGEELHRGLGENTAFFLAGL